MTVRLLTWLAVTLGSVSVALSIVVLWGVIDWGTAGEWAGALGAAAAVAFSWWVFNREHKQTEAAIAEERQQRLAEMEIARAQVAASLRQAQLAADQYAASLLPVICAAPIEDGQDYVVATNGDGWMPRRGEPVVEALPDLTVFSLVLRNIGPGIAFIRGLGLDGPGGIGWGGNISTSVVAPGENVRITCSVPKDRPELDRLHRQIEGGSVSASLGYTDIAGTMFRARADMHRDQHDIWRTRQVYLFRDGESEAFVSSAPADG